jgi:hypothetical protein
VTGELLEAGDVDAGGDPARDCAASEAMAGKTGNVEPGEPVRRLTIKAIESVSIGALPRR